MSAKTRIQVVLTPEEKAVIRAAAEARGMDASSLLRELGLMVARVGFAAAPALLEEALGRLRDVQADLEQSVHAYADEIAELRRRQQSQRQSHQPLTLAQERLASKAARYEWNMLMSASRLLRRSGTRELAVRNALVTQFATSARNVIEFLFADPDRINIRAADLVVDVDEWRTARGTCPPILKLALEAESALVAPISRERLERMARPERKEWPHVDIAAAVHPVWERFLEHAKPELSEILST